VGRIPGEARSFTFLRNVQTISGARLASYSVCTGVKRPGREAGHSSPSNAEVKTVYLYTRPPSRLLVLIVR
jgi:hypothetical protein